MKRRWKILIGVVAGLVAALILNTIAVNNETKRAEVTAEGGQLVKAVGGDMQVRLDGPTDGEPIVLIHCYPCSSSWWDGMVPPLAEKHRVIRIDLLGHGGSEKPSSGYKIEQQANAVASVLAELGVSRATVVGHSLGATVATALADESPELVARIVNIDQAPDSSFEEGLPFIAELGYKPVIGQAISRVAPDFAIRNGYEDTAFAPGYSFAAGFEDPDQPVKDFHELTYTAYKESAEAEEDYTDKAPLDERLANAGIPVLVIFGAEDQTYDAEESIEAFGDIPGVRTTLIEGAGHSPNVEKPIEVANLILEFAADPGDDQTSGSASEFAPAERQAAARKRAAARKKAAAEKKAAAKKNEGGK